MPVYSSFRLSVRPFCESIVGRDLSSSDPLLAFCVFSPPPSAIDFGGASSRDPLSMIASKASKVSAHRSANARVRSSLNSTITDMSASTSTSTSARCRSFSSSPSTSAYSTIPGPSAQRHQQQALSTMTASHSLGPGYEAGPKAHLRQRVAAGLSQLAGIAVMAEIS